MVLHVAGCHDAAGLFLAFKLVKQDLRWLAEDIDQDVETAAMCHADDHLLDAAGAAALDQFVHERDQGFCALQREAFLADIA